MKPFFADALEDLVHARARLAILAYLSTAGQADFTDLRDQVGITDGNLSLHLKKLNEAGYVAIRKKIVSNRSNTRIGLTDAGRDAFYNYLDQLKRMLDAVPEKPDL
ncbi:transcriptional regulator [Asticcacaulis sp. AND118]|uniref:winged helix-turn-helix domain-containing protein n=1 Tax=Asticcacaulis sp. AND118 TaxID=2840468 RepID=UPI001CFFA0B1|nr:transcriptional regulator [Asticcacaulis sp. AND118]UDF04865.1 transcriptional regulator [Asticcacaulis sp. AND118]